jgi:hypothetical protein
MPRAAFPSGRKLLLPVFALAVLIGGAWWWQRPPPDPVFKGAHLSALFDRCMERRGPIQNSEWRELVAPLPDFGPAAVPWLTYKFEHGMHPVSAPGLRPGGKHAHRPLENAPAWLRRWTPKKWGGLRGPPEKDERIVATSMLASLGPRAAPAIPVMTRNLESDDPLAADYAAKVLHAIDPASRPVVEDILNHGSPGARAALAHNISSRRTARERDASDAEVASVVAILVKALGDPNPMVRESAAEGLNLFHNRIKDDSRYDPLIPPLVHLLTEQSSGIVVYAANALQAFDVRAAPAASRLTELLDGHDPCARDQAVQALLRINKKDERAAACLRAMVLNSQDVYGRQLAAKLLKEYEIPNDGEKAGGESSGLQ